MYEKQDELSAVPDAGPERQLSRPWIVVLRKEINNQICRVFLALHQGTAFLLLVIRGEQLLERFLQQPQHWFLQYFTDRRAQCYGLMQVNRRDRHTSTRRYIERALDMTFFEVRNLLITRSNTYVLTVPMRVSYNSPCKD